MWVNLRKGQYLKSDMRAALNTGANMTRELERYCREAEAVLAEVKTYLDDPATPEQKFTDFPHDFEKVARLAGRVDQAGELFGRDFTATYEARVDACLRQLINYWAGRLTWGRRGPPEDGGRAA